MRGDGLIYEVLQLKYMFQSTPPHEGRLPVEKTDLGLNCFNPRPRMRGDYFAGDILTLSGGFNPRPRMRGDDNYYALLRRGAGFNPRPRMRGDIRSIIKVKACTCFNPRPRMRGDSPQLSHSV